MGDIANERKERANDSEAEVFSITKHDGAVPSLEYFDRKVFSRDTSNYKLMRGGDLAYATIHLDEGSLGVMTKGQQGIVSPMYTVFTVDESQVLPEFLYKLMKLPQNICRYQRLGEGSIHRRKSIRFNTLSSLILSIPSIDIQKSILKIIKSIEKTIEQTEDVLAKTEQLRDSLLNDCLKRGLPGHHTEWKEVSGIGVIPAAWQIMPFGDVADISFSNVDKKTRESEIPIKLCNYTDVFYNRSVHSGLSFSSATATSKEYQRWELKKDDVLFTKDSESPYEIGIPSFVCEDMPGVLLGYHLGLARPKSNLIQGKFLSLVIGSDIYRGLFARIANGVTRFGLTLDSTRAIKILVPSLVEQIQISKLIDQINEVIDSLNSEYNMLFLLKESTLEELISKGVSYPNEGR